MTSIFHIKTEDLNPDFLEALKKMFKGKNITLTVDVDMDETEYLLQSKANKKILLQSLNQVEENELVNTSVDELLK